MQIFYEKYIIEGGYKLTLQGLTNTVLVTVFGLLIGFILGSIIAIIKLIPSENPFVKVLKNICTFYVSVFRGTPVMAQLLLFHFAVFPLIGLDLPSVAEASVIFGLNSAAYISEIMRGGINSVDFGQMEAGRSLGFSYTKTMIMVVLPQALKNILPTLGNELISLIKETSIVQIVGLMDLTMSFMAVADSTFQVLISYTMLALAYYIIVCLISQLVKLMERRLAKSDRH